MIGDFIGNCHFYDHELQPKDSYFIGNSIRYLHFHDFDKDYALIGTMDGNLYGIDYSGDKVLNLIYDGQNTLTNIRTRKSNNDEFYIILGDTKGNIHILEGSK